MIDYFLNKQTDNIRNAFLTPKIKSMFDPARFHKKRSESMQFSSGDTSPEYI
jgi:hypothetical protein